MIIPFKTKKEGKSVNAKAANDMIFNTIFIINKLMEW
ncbi:hypothetical protein J2X69_005174 [Algoriphagus sp. 4150]|nr:hypothetical protein [Algoriphagus sp. 4150]